MTFAPMSIPVIETERLFLREWRESDLDMLAEVFSDAETSRYIGGVKKRWESWRQMAAYIGHWQLRGFGFWVVELKETDEPMGWCGPWAPESWPENEIGYGLLPRFQGKGYITEAAIASLKYAYRDLGWKTAISFIDSGNTASQAVAKRLGATLEGTGLLFDELPADIWRHLPPDQFTERYA